MDRRLLPPDVGYDMEYPPLAVSSAGSVRSRASRSRGFPSSRGEGIAIAAAEDMDNLLETFRETVEKNNSLRQELNLARLEKEEVLRLMAEQARDHEARVKLLNESVLRLKKENEDLQSKVEKLSLEYHTVLHWAKAAKTDALNAERRTKDMEKEIGSMRIALSNTNEALEALLLGQLAYTFILEASKQIFDQATLSNEEDPIEDWNSFQSAIAASSDAATKWAAIRTKLNMSDEQIKTSILRMTSGRISAAHPVTDFRTGRPVTKEALRNIIEKERFTGPRKRQLAILDTVAEWRKGAPTVLTSSMD